MAFDPDSPAEREPSVPELLRGKSFRRFWTAEVISGAGDWFTYVAMGTLAGRGDGSLGGLMLVLLAHTLPRAVVSPLAGTLADRLDRRRLLVGGSLGRAAFVLAMVVAAGTGSRGVLHAMHFLRMALGALTDSAGLALVPSLVTPRALRAANAFRGATWSVVFSVGMVAGGAAVAALGVRGALLVDAASFALAASLFFSLPPGVAVSRKSSETELGELRAALRVSPALRSALLGKLPVGLASGAVTLGLGHLAAGAPSLARSGLYFAALHLARGVGTGLGPYLGRRVWARHGEPGRMFGGAAVALLGGGVLAFVRAPGVAFAGALVYGLGLGANWVAGETLRMHAAPDAVRGKATAADVLGWALAQVLGALLTLGLYAARGELSVAIVGVLGLAAGLLWVVRADGLRP